MIQIYTGAHCKECIQTKRLMGKLGIDYSELQVDNDNIDILKEMGFNSLPVVITDTDKWQGFRPDKISLLVKWIDAKV